MSFTPPIYPYARLDELRALAGLHEGGVIDCSIGTPFDAPPPFVLSALARGDGARGYPPSAGTDAYRTAAAGWLRRSLHVDVPIDNVAACVGTKEFVASLGIFLKLRSPERDTILYPAVSYPTYAMGATLGGLRAVAVPMHGGRLRLDLIAHSDAHRALVLWTNSPSNPTGGLDDLSLAAAWGRERDVLVVSDECYSEYTWDGPAHSILQSGLDGVLAVHSISKRSNLAGVRAGFYAGDPEVVAYLRAVRQHAGLMVPAPVQAAVAEAYNDDEHVATQRERYRTRIELLAAALSARGIDAPLPQGTFYLWISRSGCDGWQLAHELATVAGLLASPGEFYGPDGAGFVRIALVQSNEKLQIAAHRLIEAESIDVTIVQ